MSHIQEESLGELEQAILQHVWREGPCTADDCRQALEPERVLKDSTVRTVLRRLEEKGFVRHTTEGRTFFYEAARRPNQVAASAVKGIVDRFCGGSLEQLLVGMVDNRMLSRSELERLAKKIAQAKGGNK
ncbi:MAG: BlaI/MecI/CopY family transcriptional regulator [Bryobacteraceae bacterium]|nr:BlaI/MecI/CopY family transcriptional regulator [Bryobacteraceae bacterium]